jgi:ribosome-binding factor A
MSQHRLERVRELLKRAIGEALRREIPLGGADGLVTVNDVEVSGDLRMAKVFISILGTTEQQKTGLATLHKVRHLIQSHVAREVVLKFVPHLRFFVDDSIERGDRVLRLIEELEKGVPLA